MKPTHRLADLLERRVRLQDWPLVIKFAAAPAVMLGLFLLAIAISLAALLYAQHAATTIVTHDMRLVSSLGSISSRFDHEDGNLYRLLVDQAAGGGKTRQVAERAAGIRARLARVRADLAAVRPSLAPDEGRHVAGILAQMDRYSDAVGVVSSMLDVDFSASATMLAPFRSNADRVIADIDAMVRNGTAEAHAHADAAAHRTRLLVLLVIGAVLLLATVSLVAPLAIGRATIRSIRRIAEATGFVAAGRHDIDLDTFSRRDELGQIVVALKTFRAQAIEKTMLEQDAAEEERRRAAAVAEADARAVRARQAMVDDLMHAFETKVRSMIGEAEAAMGRLEVHAGELHLAVINANGLASRLEDLAEGFVAEMHQAGAATGALTTAIRRIDQETEHTSRIATAILARAASATVEVSGSEQRAASVERVVDVIDSIARATNLLALNATIEAARCGDAGRGFAVVAAEIKALSGRTSLSTGDVRRQVREVQEGVTRVVSETAELSQLIAQMDEVASRVSATSRDQAQTTGLIDARIEAVRIRVRSLSDVSSSIRAAANGNEQSLADLRADSQGLQRALANLSEDAQSFIGLLRAS